MPAIGVWVCKGLIRIVKILGVFQDNKDLPGNALYLATTRCPTWHENSQEMAGDQVGLQMRSMCQGDQADFYGRHIDVSQKWFS